MTDQPPPTTVLPPTAPSPRPRPAHCGLAFCSSQELVITSSILPHPSLGQVKIRLNTTNLRKLSFIITQTHVMTMGLELTDFLKINMACCIILKKDQSPPRFQVLPCPSMSMFLCSPSAPSAVLEPQDTQVFHPM